METLENKEALAESHILWCEKEIEEAKLFFKVADTSIVSVDE